MRSLVFLIQEEDRGRATELLRIAAESGDAEALYDLAKMAEGEDHGRALLLLEQAAESGNSLAMNNLAILLGPEDRSRARDLLETAAAAREPSALSILADEVQGEDRQRAIELNEEAVAQGDRYAKWNLARLLVGEDRNRAIELFEQAADEDDSMALNWLAYLIEDENRPRAIELLARAIWLGNDFAMLGLARLIVEQDRDAAICLYELAAEHGNADAMNDLSDLIYREDPTRVIHLYERAVDAGHIRAMVGLSVVIWDEDRSRAIDLLEQAASTDDAYAVRRYADLIQGENRQRAIELYERAIELGSDVAVTNFAILLVSEDRDRAIELFEQAVARDDSTAMNWLACQIEDDDRQRAVQLNEQAIELGNTNAMYSLARLVANDDRQRAIELYEQAIELGNAAAMYNLALLLRDEDRDRAIGLFERAAAHGHSSAMDWLGFLIKEDDPQRAAELYEQAIELGNTSAMKNLARLVADDDRQRAIELYEQAIELGNEVALTDLAILLVGEDRDRAIDLFEQAVARNDATAMNWLAYQIKGDDPQRAAELYERAIDLGVTDAMVNLADLIVGDDRRRARRLLVRAAELGDSSAKGKLAADRSTRIILLDLDQTLVLSESLAPLRQQGAWNRVYDALHLTRVPEGTKELLDELRACYSIGVVTMAPRAYAERLIEHHGLDIDVVVAFHDTQHHKPSPDPLLLAANRLGVDPRECLYIGDDDRDRQAAVAAGMKFIMVDFCDSGPADALTTWGEVDRAILEGYGRASGTVVAVCEFTNLASDVYYELVFDDGSFIHLPKLGAADAGGSLPADAHGGEAGGAGAVFDAEASIKRLTSQVDSRALAETASMFFERSDDQGRRVIRQTDGRLGATNSDPDVFRVDPDTGVVTFHNPDTGRPFSGDNPHSQATQWMEGYNAELWDTFNRVVENRRAALEKELGPVIERLKYTAACESLDPLRQKMLDILIEEYRAYDSAGNHIGFNCDLNAALAEMNRQAAAIEVRRGVNAPTPPGGWPRVEVIAGHDCTAEWKNGEPEVPQGLETEAPAFPGTDAVLADLVERSMGADTAYLRYRPWGSAGRNETTYLVLDFKNGHEYTFDCARFVFDHAIRSIQKQVPGRPLVLVAMPSSQEDKGNPPVKRVLEDIAPRFSGVELVPNALVRTKSVQKAATSGGSRPTAMTHRGSIEWRGPRLSQGSVVVMFDDVYTTGAMANGCREVIETSTGCKEVYGVYLAHTYHDDDAYAF